jgi:hypothetical protein
MEELMNQPEFNLFHKIKARDGLLMAQLFEFLPRENRMSYSTFKRKIEKGRAAENVLKVKPYSKSHTVFLTATHRLSQRRLTWMVMLAEWELKNERNAG